MTEAEAQAALAGIALELVAITDRLHQIQETLPPSRNREAMLEHRVPYLPTYDVCQLLSWMATVQDGTEPVESVGHRATWRKS